MDRADLHALVDTIPDGALENAKRVLEHLQIWPPQPPPELERMQIREEHMERMRRSMRPGTCGGGGGDGSFNPTTGCGHLGHTHREDDTAVNDTYHFFKGHEIAVTERLRFTRDGKAIHYIHQVKGAKRDSIENEMTFDVE